jgi:hypothetical protein
VVACTKVVQSLACKCCKTSLTKIVERLVVVYMGREPFLVEALHSEDSGERFGRRPHEDPLTRGQSTELSYQKFGPCEDILARGSNKD